jgi:ABC-type phosphate transport system substrate-binding protein
MNRWKRILCLLAGALIAGAAAAQEYEVIAHPSVPIASVSAKDLSPLFLKKVTTYDKWGNGQKAVPFDLASSSQTREAFSKAVHGKPVAAIKSFWQQQIFSGRGAPPAELASDADMMAAVARTPGAIGYVKAGATLAGGVKQVRVTQ